MVSEKLSQERTDFLNRSTSAPTPAAKRQFRSFMKGKAIGIRQTREELAALTEEAERAAATVTKAMSAVRKAIEESRKGLGAFQALANDPQMGPFLKQFVEALAAAKNNPLMDTTFIQKMAEFFRMFGGEAGRNLNINELRRNPEEFLKILGGDLMDDYNNGSLG